MEHEQPLDQQTEIIRQRQFQILERLADFSGDMRTIQETLAFHDRVLHSCCPNEMPRGAGVGYQGSGVGYQGSGVPFQFGVGYQGSGVGYQGSGVGYQGSGVPFQFGGGLFKSMFKRKKSKRRSKKSKRRRRKSKKRKSRTRRRSR